MTLQDELRAFIDRRKAEGRETSQAKIAKSLALSPSTLSLWLKGTYDGNIQEIDDAVRSFLQREEELDRNPNWEPEFQMTSIAKQLFEIAKLAHIYNEIGVVVGAPGVGKTWAARAYVEKQPGTVLIEVDSSYTPKVLFRQVCAALKIDGGKQLNPAFEAALGALTGSKRLLVVDEAEHLSIRALELLRRLHDKAGIGLLLVGTPELYHNIRNRVVDFAQLYSRVGAYRPVERITMSDVEKIVSSVYPQANGLCKVFAKHANGNARRLVKLIQRAERVSRINQRPIDTNVIETATQYLIA